MLASLIGVTQETEGVITYEQVITIDTEAACLLLYPLSEWEQIEAKLDGIF